MFRSVFAALSLMGLAGCISTGWLTRPIFCGVAPGDTAHLDIVEQGGTVQALNLSNNSLTEVLDISELVFESSERGLPGLAFHPDFATNRKLYVNLTAVGTGATQIWKFTAPLSFGVIDPATKRLILQFDQPQSNHHGGWIAFGPDEFLDIASGDGGGGNDSDIGHTPGIGNAQNITDNLLGKLLRSDVRGRS